MIDFPNSLFI